VSWPACASVSHGQETNQFTEDDVEFSDLGWRGIYAAAIHVPGAFCVEDFLGEIARRDQEPTKIGCAKGQPPALSWSEGRLSQHKSKKAAPFLGPQFKEARW
jgi:hypothetical protein